MPGNIPDPLWVYRIVHYSNLRSILEEGMFSKNHPNASAAYCNIGNSEIIATRSRYAVRIEGYGYVGDYVPFYFGTNSIMLYNILTGYNVPKQEPSDIVYLCCMTQVLADNCTKFFFSDGQANTLISEHFNNLEDLNKVSWDIIGSYNFTKSNGDIDRPRKYQAEFLVYEHVSVNCIGKIVVHNKNVGLEVQSLLKELNLNIPLRIGNSEHYYFNF